VTNGQRVVVVDGVPETAEVLREVFEPRGHRVERVRGFDRSEPAPGSVLVVHDDGSGGANRTFRYGTTPRVVIGSIVSQSAMDQSCERTLTHPFQYAELIRAVEALLANEVAQRSAA
jgi:CheY-like chemotaxis protein